MERFLRLVLATVHSAMSGQIWVIAVQGPSTRCPGSPPNNCREYQRREKGELKLKQARDPRVQATPGEDCHNPVPLCERGLQTSCPGPDTLSCN